MKKLENIHKILVINLGGIGDLLLSTPALRAIKERYPDAAIDMMVVPRAAEVARSLSCIGEVFVFGICGIYVIKDILTLVGLRRKGYDLAVNMRTLVSRSGAEKMKFVLGMINPRVKAGRDTDGSGYFFDIRIPETLPGEKYEMEYDIDMARALGADVRDKKIDLAVGEESAAAVDKLLEEAGVARGDTLIGIHPGGSPSHRWPLGNFAKVIDELHRKFHCKFVITGDKGEKPLLQELRRMSRVPLALLPESAGIKELEALIRRCDLYICNDTGPMHIAAILGRPLVAIFGPGYIKRFDPRNISDKAAVLYKKAGCAPCDKPACPDMKCLKDISPAEVLAEAERLMSVKG